MYICLDSVESCGPCTPHSDTDDGGAGWEPEPESLGEALRRFNTSVEALPALTDFHTGLCRSPHALPVASGSPPRRGRAVAKRTPARLPGTSTPAGARESRGVIFLGWRACHQPR